MTEEQVKELGFEYDHQYPHGTYLTKRYKNGNMLIEFTYKEDRLLSFDMSIIGMDVEDFTFEELQTITPILSKWSK